MMNRQAIIKKCWLISKLPFVNHISMHGGILKTNKAVLVGCRINCKGHNNTIILDKNIHAHSAEFHIEDNANRITVGESTCFAGKIHLACTESTDIEIGKNCLFSSEIVIRTGDSHAICDMEGKRINCSKNVIIGDHVWVAYRALINKGTVLKDNTVVGTGSVVTKEFSKGHIIVAGVPAKVIREDVTWNEDR